MHALGALIRCEFNKIWPRGEQLPPLFLHLKQFQRGRSWNRPRLGDNGCQPFFENNAGAFAIPPFKLVFHGLSSVFLRIGQGDFQATATHFQAYRFFLLHQFITIGRLRGASSHFVIRSSKISSLT